MPPLRFALALCCVSALAACSFERKQESSSPATAEGASAATPSDPSRKVEAEPTADIAIETRDGNVVLALGEDEVFMRLSDKALAEASKELKTRDTDPKDTKVGAMIEDMVKKGIEKAINSRIVYQLHEIRDVRYEDGEIRFEYRDKHVMSFETFKGEDDENVMSRFRPDDARRFVSAVKQALRKS